MCCGSIRSSTTRSVRRLCHPSGLWLAAGYPAASPVSRRVLTIPARRVIVCSFLSDRLDVVDERRYMTSRGWDAYSPPGTFGRIDRVRGLSRDALEEELFSIRAMRHIFRIRSNLNASEWQTVLTPIRRAMPHFLLTQERTLLEPSMGESITRGTRLASVEWRGGGNPTFRPRKDGMD